MRLRTAKDGAPLLTLTTASSQPFLPPAKSDSLAPTHAHALTRSEDTHPPDGQTRAQHITRPSERSAAPHPRPVLSGQWNPRCRFRSASTRSPGMPRHLCEIVYVCQRPSVRSATLCFDLDGQGQGCEAVPSSPVVCIRLIPGTAGMGMPAHEDGRRTRAEDLVIHLNVVWIHGDPGPAEHAYFVRRAAGARIARSLGRPGRGREGGDKGDQSGETKFRGKNCRAGLGGLRGTPLCA